MSNLRLLKLGLKELLFSDRQRRIEQLETIIENEKKHLELTRKEHALYKQLSEGLPQPKLTMLMEYSDVLNDIIVLQEEFFYTFGIRDCIRILFMLLGK